jgi:two-component sensor histidine kinase
VFRVVTVRHVPASAGVVRRQLGAELSAAGLPAAVVGDAALVVSELVGNAVRYARPLAGGVLDVTWSVTPDCIRLEVTDGGGPSVPRRSDAGPADVRGRGLAIVTALARDWGVEVHPDGTAGTDGAPAPGPTSTVWVEIAVKPE